MSDRSMVKEAHSIIKGIREHQANATEKMANFERQVDDLKKAQRLLSESVTKAPIVTHGGDSKLRSYVRDDGTLQLGTEKRSINIPGSGTYKTEVEGLFTATVPANEWHKDLIRLSQERAWCRSLMTNPHTPKADLRLHKHIQTAPREIRDQLSKAFYDVAGSGGDWIPDEFRSELYETFKIPRGLRGLLDRVEMDANVLNIPTMTRGGRPYLKGQVSTDSPTDYPASTVATGLSSVSIAGFATRYVIDDSAAEDSALNLMSVLNKQIAEDLSSAYEDAFVNGDTAAAHADAIGSWDPRGRWGSTGLGGASDHRRAFLGLRQKAFDLGGASVLAGTSAGVSTAELVSAIGSMGELGTGDCICVVSPEAMIKHLMGNDDLATVDKFGPLASLVNGQIASLFGFPVVMSRFLTADLAANGLYTGAGTQTGILFFNRSSWKNVERSGIRVETSKNIAAGAIELVSTLRSGAYTFDSATTRNVAFIRDLNS